MSWTKFSKQRTATGMWAGAILTAVAALIIGCGGGGDSGSTTGLTTGTLTNTTGTQTNTTGTQTNTTGTQTTTTTTTGSGLLQPNAIYFVDSAQDANGNLINNFNYLSMPATGNPTSPTISLFASLPVNFGSVAYNSVNQTKYFSYTASTSAASFGIYSASTFTAPPAAGVTTILAPSTSTPFAYISNLQLSPDGTTLYFYGLIGNNEGTIYSMPAAGGTPTALDSVATQFSLNAAGNQLVYDKLVSGVSQIFTRGVAPSSTPTQITNYTYDCTQPQWDKSGANICFVSDTDPNNQVYYIAVMKANGTGLTRMTNTANQTDVAPTFNGAGTQLAFVSETGGAASLTGLYTISLSGGVDANRTEIWSDQNIQEFGTYWTTASSRGIGKSWSAFNLKKRKGATAIQKPAVKASRLGSR